MFRHSLGNMVFKQAVCISVGFDLASFWANLFLYFLESKYIKQLILNGCFHTLMTFDDNMFLTPFQNIYPKELDLKVERRGNRASFLDLDIKVGDSVFVYKALYI